MRTAYSIKAILPHAIAFLEAANAERAIGMPLDQLAHQPGIQDAFVKPGLILGRIERHSRHRQQLERLCRPGVAARLHLVAGLVQRVTYQRGVPTLLIPLGYSPVVMALPLVFSHAGIPLGKARSPHFSNGDFGLAVSCSWHPKHTGRPRCRPKCLLRHLFQKSKTLSRFFSMDSVGWSFTWIRKRMRRMRIPGAVGH
jgi:hypothetical protein